MTLDANMLPALVGNTPLIHLKLIDVNIYAKAEFMNPSGSVKDRPMLRIMQDAMASGALKPGDTLVEATSGNAGISFAMFCAHFGIKCVLIMPRNMSQERKNAFKAYGAELIEVADGAFDEAISLRDKLAREKGWFNGNQFGSQLNIQSHIEGTGAELVRQLDEIGVTPSAFVSGTGTGGTIMGVGKVFRERFPGVKIIAVEPEESAVMSGKSPGVHGIQGIGDGSKFLVNLDEIDFITTVSTENAKYYTRKLASEYGLFVGFSAASNIFASLVWAKSHGQNNVATILCDRGDRYFSNLF